MKIVCFGTGIISQSSSQPGGFKPDEIKGLGHRLSNYLTELGGNHNWTPVYVEITKEKKLSLVQCDQCKKDVVFGTFTLKNTSNGKQLTANHKTVHDMKEHGMVRHAATGKPFLDLALLKEILN